MRQCKSLKNFPSDITMATSGQTNLGNSTEIYSNLFSDTVPLTYFTG